MVLDHSQVVPSQKKFTIRESMYPSWAPQNIRLACTPGTNKTNPFYSYQGEPEKEDYDYTDDLGDDLTTGATSHPTS